MKFGYTILYVDQVEATLDFYQRAFGLQRRFLDETKQYGELETGDTRLAFAAKELVGKLIPLAIAPTGSSEPAAAFELGLVTEDVEAAYDKALSAGAFQVKRPEPKPWGQLVGYIRDLNGFLVEICSPMP